MSISIPMSTQELQHLTPSEGIVIGSILVQSEESKDDEASEASFLSSKWWSQLFQLKAKDYNYYMIIWRLSVPKYQFNRDFAWKYEVKSKHGSEKIFIAKLEGGEYHFAYMAVADDCEALSYVDDCEHPYFSEDIDVRFLVTPGGTTYIGRLVVNVPAILWPSDITIEVQDAQGSTIEESTEKYADQVKEVSKKLMRPEKSVVLLDYRDTGVLGLYGL